MNAETGKTFASEIYALAKKRGFFWQSFEIYGGISGLFDYGPLGTILKQNIESLFRKYYCTREGFFEIDCVQLAPQIVFKASGHIDEFTDSMVVCQACKQTYKADLNLKNCPECEGILSKPSKVNLMFRTSIGVEGRDCYLRPETAQSMFYNFPFLYRFVREKLPFGIIQVGKGYRNEISPRQGMIRLREFNMAEAEVFTKPTEKKWHKFGSIADEELNFVFDNVEEKLLAGEAVAKKISYELLVYFMALTKKFLVSAGLDDKKIRFRKHGRDEIAHYAMECWDCEYLTKAYGWVELAGIADRGCYDLTQHMKYSNADLTVFEKFDTTREIEKIIVQPKPEAIGKRFKREATAIIEQLKNIELPSEPADVSVNVGGRNITLPKDCYKVVRKKIKKTGERYVANVVEPSYGIDRIIYAVLEEAYCRVKKEGEDYTVLKLKPWIAPVKAAVLPLVAKNDLKNYAYEIYNLLRNDFVVYYDEAGSIGRRYARMDEIGTPYCITVDYESIEKKDVTIRDRDTTKQVRIKTADLPKRLEQLIKG